MTKHTNESLSLFLVAVTILIYGSVGIETIHSSIVRFAFVFKLKVVFGQQTDL